MAYIFYTKRRTNMTKNEMAKKLIRDYAHEHKIRAKKKKRFACDIEKNKAHEFEALLKSQDTTFSAWIKERINEYMEKEI